jgi:hypothetical protein
VPALGVLEHCTTRRLLYCYGRSELAIPTLNCMLVINVGT